MAPASSSTPFHDPAVTSTPVTGSDSTQRVNLFQFALVVISFLVLYFTIVPVEGVDTVRYAADAIKHASGVKGQFWEFGHLFWRPWAYFGFTVFGGTIKSIFHDTDLQATSRFLILTDFFASLGAVLLLWDWLRRLTSTSVATFVAIAFCGANGFLQQICMGSAYMPAIFFQLLALWLLARATTDASPGRSRPTLLAALAGFCFAFSTMLWFPFFISGLGVVISPLLFMPPALPLRSALARLARLAVPFLLVLALTAALGFGSGAMANGIHDPHRFLQWVTEANNGWSQSMNIVRAATGFPRSFFELTDDGVALKRWFIHDPYHRVTIAQLVRGPLLKLAAFYAGMLALLYLLTKTRSSFRIFLVLGAVLVPLVFFAIVLFEATSTNRYLPGFAFLFAGIALAFQQGPRRSVATWVLGFLLVAALVANLVQLGILLPGEAAEVRSQRIQLESSLTQPAATVFALTLHEPFYVIPISRPLDHSLWSTRVDVTDLIEQASTRVPHWRGEFAAVTLASWNAGKEVWVTASVLQPVPPPPSTWVEGDDKRINWTQIHDFFQQVATDKSSGGPGGFVRIAHNDANQIFLTRLAAQEPPAPHPGE